MNKNNRKFILSLAHAAGARTAAQLAAFLRMHHYLLANSRGVA